MHPRHKDRPPMRVRETVTAKAASLSNLNNSERRLSVVHESLKSYYVVGTNFVFSRRSYTANIDLSKVTPLSNIVLESRRYTDWWLIVLLSPDYTQNTISPSINQSCHAVAYVNCTIRCIALLKTFNFIAWMMIVTHRPDAQDLRRFGVRSAGGPYVALYRGQPKKRRNQEKT